jgi:hypothetical protein
LERYTEIVAYTITEKAAKDVFGVFVDENNQ